MKAVILAAGKGTRLGDLTREIPKPLLRVHGKPILQHNIELCRKHKVTELYVNTHHHAEKIVECFGDGSRFGVSISYSYEPELLGTSGALRSFQENLSREPFFVIYADNYSNYDLNVLTKKFNSVNSIGVVAFHHREDVQSSGVAEFDEYHRITRFIEKPKPGETESHWVNAGMYYLSPRIFEFIPLGFSDFGQHIFPKILVEKIPLYGVCENFDVRAFDTPESYNNAVNT